MGIAEQSAKLKKLIPYIRQKFGDEIELEASLQDKFWVKDLLKKDAIRREQALEVYFRNLGSGDFTAGMSGMVPHVFGQGANEPTPETAPNIEIAARCLRRLDALVWLSKQPGFFKAAPVLDSVGQQMFDYGAGAIVGAFDAVEIVRLKNEGVL